MSIVFPRKFRRKILDHMEENEKWSIYSIADLLEYEDPTRLLDGLSKLTRQELAVHKRVLIEDCMIGWKLNDG